MIGYVEVGGPAEEAGLMEGDRVLSVDGTPIKHFSSPVDSVVERVVFSKGEKIEFVVERDGKELKFDVGFEKMAMGSSRRGAMRSVGIGSTGPVGDWRGDS